MVNINTIGRRNAHDTSIGQGTHDPISAVDAALDAGGLFEVRYDGVALPDGSIPVFETGTYKDQPRHLQIWRPDTNKRLGIHSGQYPQSSYGFLATEIEALFPESCTKVTVFGDGERIAFTQVLGEPVDLGGGDVIQPNLLWVTSHNGTWATTGLHLVQRAFCTNQMRMAATFIKVRKTRNHDGLLADRLIVMATAMHQAKLVADVATYLREQTVVDAEFLRIVTTLLPVLDDDASTKAKNKRDAQVGAAWSRWQLEQQGPSAGTKWAAYSALQAADYHDLPMIGARRGTDRNERQTVALLDNEMSLSDRYLKVEGVSV